MKIRIKYFTDKIDKLCYIDGKSDWIDLRCAKEVQMKAGEFRLIPLGVAMERNMPVCSYSPRNGQCIGRRCPFSALKPSARET